jgi:hypothetical protein
VAQVSLGILHFFNRFLDDELDDEVAVHADYIDDVSATDVDEVLALVGFAAAESALQARSSSKRDLVELVSLCINSLLHATTHVYSDRLMKT